MNRILKFSNLALAVITVVSAGTAIANDGVVPPGPNDQGYTDFIKFTEALGGVGRTKNLSDQLAPTEQEHNTFCGGLLVAPNIVLAPRHAFSDTALLPHWGEVLDAVDNDEMIINESKMWFDSTANSPIPKYTVRFRLLNDQGDVGSLTGGYESFYQAPVKRIVFPARRPDLLGTPLINETEFEIDMVLLILSDGEDDNQNDGLWENGWIEHIDPVHILPTLNRSSIAYAGTQATYGPLNTEPNTQGILRLREYTNLFFADANQTDCFTLLNNIAPISVGDSGGVIFAENESGEYIARWGLALSGQSGGGLVHASCLPGSLTWDMFFPEIPHEYGNPYLFPASEFDVTGSPSITSPEFYAGYNKPNRTINSDDVVAMAALNPNYIWADYNEDGNVTILDFELYVEALSQATNPYALNPLFPLPAGICDVNGDLRLTPADAMALEQLVPNATSGDLVHDYNGDGQIEMGDVEILERVITATVGLGQERIFDHGVFGDFDGNNIINCADQIGLQGLLFDGTERVDIPGSGYKKELDSNMNQILDVYDKRRLAARVVPGDLVTGYSYFTTSDPVLWFNNRSSPNPDFDLELFDARKYLTLTYVKETSATQLIGADVVGEEWIEGGDYLNPDGLITYEDRVFTFMSWLGSCNSSFETESLLDFWFFDHNGDGRVNFLDARSVSEMFANNPSVYFPEWDMNSDGEIDSDDELIVLRTVHVSSAYGQGFLGDYDGTGSPACINNCLERDFLSVGACEDVSPNDCKIPIIEIGGDCDDFDFVFANMTDLFESGYKYGDDLYKIQLDADLDGDMDLDDVNDVLLALQPADLVTDGVVNFFDVSFFMNAYAVLDPAADFNGDGVVNFFDVSEFAIVFAAACQTEL